MILQKKKSFFKIRIRIQDFELLISGEFACLVNTGCIPFLNLYTDLRCESDLSAQVTVLVSFLLL